MNNVILKTRDEIKIMAQGGKLLSMIIKKLQKHVKPGITTKELDNLA